MSTLNSEGLAPNHNESDKAANSDESSSYEPANNVMVHVVAPLAAMAATWMVRKALNSGYRAIRGEESSGDSTQDMSFAAAVGWAALTAATAAVVEVSVFRLLTGRNQ